MRILCILTLSSLALTGCAHLVRDSGGAKVAKVEADLSTISAASDLFRLDHGRYPESLEELVNPPDVGRGMKYLKEMPVDPWTEEPYMYEIGDDGPEIVSYGADMAEGGEGLDTDIFSSAVGR